MRQLNSLLRKGDVLDDGAHQHLERVQQPGHEHALGHPRCESSRGRRAPRSSRSEFIEWANVDAESRSRMARMGEKSAS
jgi:hypothetical protein